MLEAGTYNQETVDWLGVHPYGHHAMIKDNVVFFVLDYLVAKGRRSGARGMRHTAEACECAAPLK